MSPRHLPPLARWASAATLAALACCALAQGEHVVARGDTLYDIAGRYGTTVEQLRFQNGLSSDLLTVGQRLSLPGGEPFRKLAAAAGDSLASLAAAHGLSLDSVAAANPGLDSGQPLAAGTAVRLPAREGLPVRLQHGETILDVALRHGVAPSMVAVEPASAADGASDGVWALVQVAPPAAPSPAAQVARPVAGAAWHAQAQVELFAALPALLDRFEPGSTGLVWPLSGRLSSAFGWRDISVGGNRFHGGIDLAADRGTAVGAARDGVVSRSGWIGAYGYAVYLDHGDGSETRYAHLQAVLVSVGEVVRQGDPIGLVGSSGASTGPHLHFELRLGGRAVDPLPHLETPSSLAGGA